MGAMPVPVKANVCGLPVALSVTFTVAVRAPFAVGVNVAAMVQLAPAATVLTVRQSVTPVAVGTSKRSPELPVVVSRATFVIDSVEPLLVKTEVMGAALVVLTRWLPNWTVEGA